MDYEGYKLVEAPNKIQKNLFQSMCRIGKNIIMNAS